MTSYRTRLEQDDGIATEDVEVDADEPEIAAVRAATTIEERGEIDLSESVIIRTNERGLHDRWWRVYRRGCDAIVADEVKR